MKKFLFFSFTHWFLYTTFCFSQGILTPVWMKTKVSPLSSGFAEAWAVDVDASENVYWVANADSVSSQGHDIFCYKFDSNGNPLWVNPLYFGGIDAQQSYVCNAQDTFLYVGGRNAVNGFNSDMLLLKVDKSNGSLVWSKTYNFGISGYNEIDGLEIRNDGIYCGGWAQAITTGNYKVDVGLLKLDFNGDTIWKNYFGQANMGEHQDGHFVVDNDNIFAAGLWGGTSLSNFYNGWGFLGKFSKTNGSFVDSTLFGYQSNNFGDLENALGMTTDGTYLYVTGYTSPTTNNMQIMIAKFDKNLNLLWNQNWGGSNAESARGIAVSNGMIFIAGTTKSYSNNPRVNQDAVLLAYDTSGNFLSYKTWGDSLTDEFRDIAIYGNNIYLSGTSSGNNDTAFIIKTDVNSILTLINENNIKKFSVQINPNPFSMQTVLHTDNLLHNATLKVLNVFGQTVKEITPIIIGAGQSVILSRDNLASGLYFARLTQDNQVIATVKLVITN